MKERVNNRKRVIPIEIKAMLVIVVLLFVGLLTTYILKSYARFEKKESYNIVNAKVGEFYKEFAYTGSVQEYTVPITGYYDIELWGSSGSNINAYSGGKGGYTKGTIYLEKDEPLYFYVGSSSTGSSVSGFNGGTLPYNVGTVFGSGGGGATDIRLTSGTWNESTSLRSRIMVAGAGSGAGNRGGNNGDGNGGGGGNLLGGKGTSVNNTNGYGYWIGQGGTQRSGGELEVHNGTNSLDQQGLNDAKGTFGSGGMGGHVGGGGGYYGGAGASHAGGGGGSSYISGYSGVNSVQQSGGTAAQPLHTNNTIHYSNKYFINGKMQSGVNQGNGKAKIRLIQTLPSRVNTKLNNVRYIKSCVNGNSGTVSDLWIELQAMKDGVNIAKNKTVTGTVAANITNPYSRIVDGLLGVDEEYLVRISANGLQCITIDLGTTFDLDEVVVWHYYKEPRVFYENRLSVGPTNVSGTTSLSSILHNYPGTTGYVETSQGRRYNAWSLTAVE